MEPRTTRTRSKAAESATAMDVDGEQPNGVHGAMDTDEYGQELDLTLPEPDVKPAILEKNLALENAMDTVRVEWVARKAEAKKARVDWINAAERVDTLSSLQSSQSAQNLLPQVVATDPESVPKSALYCDVLEATANFNSVRHTAVDEENIEEYSLPDRKASKELQSPDFGTPKTSSASTEQLAISVKAQLAAYHDLRQNMPIRPSLQRSLGLAQMVVDGDDPVVDNRLRKLKDMDLVERAAARESEIAARIACRVDELQNLPITVPPHLAIRARTELKAYKLLAYQREMKRRLLPLMHPHTSPATALVVGALKRPSVPKVRNLAETNRIELQNREFAAARKKELANSQINAILRHARAFWAFHQNVRYTRIRITRAVEDELAQRDKDSGRAAELAEKERMRLLMAEDEEGYRKLIDKKKHKRLAYLLEKTDEFMASMMADITAHQDRERVSDAKKAAAAAAVAAAAAAPEDGNGNGPSDLDLWDGQSESAKAMVGRYGAAHRIVEKVTKQSSLLVNGTLKEYQIEGLEWLVSLYNNKLNGILADEMGLGKTIQTLSLITYLMEHHGVNGPHLVIVPLSTLSNWVNEFEKWAPSLKTIIFHGNKLQRRSLSAEVSSGAFNVVVTTYEYIIREKSVLGRVHWRYMIIDEGHRMKNHSCKLQTVLADSYTAPRRLLLTGTPLQNNLPELWSLLNFCLPAIFKSSESFESWFSAPFAGTGEKVEMSEEEKLIVVQRLHKVLRPFMLRRLKKEVEKQLPDKVEYVLRCEMSGLQRRMYRYVKTHNFLLVPDSDIDSSNKSRDKGQNKRSLQNTVMQLRKICNHPYLFEAVERGMVAHSREKGVVRQEDLWRVGGKFELLDRIVPKMQAAGHRILCFCQMTALMTILEDYLVMKGVQYLRLDGTTGAPERQKLLKDFNAPDSPYDMFILSTRAGGLGLNLQTADTVIIFDSDWNPTMDAQAQDRAHRIGQKNEVRVFRLQTVNSVEETILEAARHKMNLDKQVIQAGMFNSKSSSTQQKDFLLQVFEEEDFDAGEGEISNDEMNEMLARNEEELALFNRMDEQRAKDDRAAWQSPFRRTRLLEARELPSWALKSDEEVAALCQPKESKLEEEALDLDGGRRQRQKRKVAYGESLSEEAWLRAVDNGTLDDALARAEREAKSKRKREEDAIANRPDKRAELEEQAKRRRIEQEEAAAIERAIAAIPEHVLRSIKALVHDVTSFIDREGRLVAQTFQNLPDRAAKPEYYTAVASPISFHVVHEKVRRGVYSSTPEVITDISTIIENAKKVYDAGTVELRDAELLERALADAKAHLV